MARAHGVAFTAANAHKRWLARRAARTPEIVGPYSPA